jgi:4-carboxymuconolactone decarboxylase
MRIVICAALLAAMMGIVRGQVDIDPVTLSRFPPVKREDMPDRVKKFYDEQNGPSPDGTPFLRRGPQHLYLYSPAVADTMGRLMSSVREQGVLGDRLTEIAILVTAREISHQFIWSAHEPAARRSGVEPAIIDAIKYNRDVAGLGEKETVIIRFARQLIREKKVSPNLFAKSVELLGRQGVVELTAIMGSYVGTALMLDAADQQQPPTRPALLPAR